MPETVWKADYDAKVRALRRVEEERDYAVKVLTFLSNTTDKTCRCNTIANPCPACRIRQAIDWFAMRREQDIVSVAGERP